uniref:Uncharacterized protein n=1 Tax=Arundo donax TaxID=35708 RepID=A0A0A8YGY0_ARUDO
MSSGWRASPTPVASGHADGERNLSTSRLISSSLPSLPVSTARRRSRTSRGS